MVGKNDINQFLLVCDINFYKVGNRKFMLLVLQALIVIKVLLVINRTARLSLLLCWYYKNMIFRFQYDFSFVFTSKEQTVIFINLQYN